jgi:hypothetical protein
LVVLGLSACGGDDSGGSSKDQAAEACDDYIALLRQTQAGTLDRDEAIDGVTEARNKAVAAAEDDGQWDDLVESLDRIITILRSGDQADFASASRALQTTCADAFDLEAP